MTSYKTSNVVAALCCLLILSSFIISTQSAWCCLGYISAHHISCHRFLNYKIQNNTGSCDMNAIIFHTKRRFLCADPLLEYTQKVMNCINERNIRIAQILG